MKKELKDYLHLYLGCECRLGSSDLKFFVTAIQSDSNLVVVKGGKDYRRGQFVEPENIKLFLRPLSDMTEEEMKELYLSVFKRPFVGDNITHRDIGKEQERKVLWSGCDRLFIYKDGDVGADCDLHHYPVHAPSIVLWQLSKHFDLFGLIESGLAIDKTLVTKDIENE